MVLYFTPVILGLIKGKRILPIFLMDLFLGWTVIGWFVALYWALRDQQERFSYHNFQGAVLAQSETKLEQPQPRGYQTRSSVMNRSEIAFYFELEKQIPKEYHIFPNMRIADFIDATDGKGFYNRRNKILPKHVDFLICDPSFKPIVAVEVNGSSHHRRDRIERDELVREIFAEAKLPLEWVDVGSSFEQSVARVKSYLLSL